MTREPLSTSSSEGEPVGKAHNGGKVFVPWAAITAIVAIGCFEVGIWNLRHSFEEPHNSLLEVKRKFATSAAPPDSIAILGSSRFYHIRPDRISAEAIQAGKVSNYSWAWCGLEAYEAMLRTLIQAGRKPKTILVDGIPEAFGYPLKHLTISADEGALSRYSTAFPANVGLKTVFRLGLWESGWDMFQRALTPYSLRYRNGIMKSFREFLKSGKLPAPPDNYKLVVEKWKQDGWILFAPADYVATQEEFQEFEQAAGSHKLYKNPSALRTYEQFLELAQRYNIRVILLPVPNNPWMYLRFKDEGVYAAYDEWLDRLEQRYTIFTAPEPRILNWPDAMGDPGHVNQQGAERHMKLVIELLQRELPGN